MLGDRAFLTPDHLLGLADALRGASLKAEPHEAGVEALTAFLSEHFPVLCEVIAEVARSSGYRRFHYWCDVAEMCAEYANYHFTFDGEDPVEPDGQPTPSTFTAGDGAR